MNRSRLLMIGGLALAIGLLVSYAVYTQMQAAAGKTNTGSAAQVVVAANDIQVGTKLAASDVTTVTIPADRYPSRGVLHTREDPGPRRNSADEQRRIYSAR